MITLIHDASNKGESRLSLSQNWDEARDVAAMVKVSYDGGVFILTWCVREPQLRRMCTHQNDEVWKDSCVEAFLKKPDDDEYVNFEFSASGYCHVARGVGRQGRVSYPDALLDTIAVSVRILENTTIQSRWELTARLELSKFGLLGEGESLKGKTLYGNFYNCGDSATEPHYLTYAPIDTARPDFHRKEAFVPLQFV